MPIDPRESKGRATDKLRPRQTAGQARSSSPRASKSETPTNRLRFSRAAVTALVSALVASTIFAMPAAAKESPQPKVDLTVREANSTGTDRFIVKFKDRVAARPTARSFAYGAQAKELGVSVTELKTIGTGAQVVKTGRMLNANEAEALVADLEADPAVEYAEPDTIVSGLALNPDDPFYSTYQWDLTDRDYGLDISPAWDITLGDGVTVAVIDSGVVSHHDLNANVLPGYDMISDSASARDGNGRDANPRDEGTYGDGTTCGTKGSSWHGAHVAGTIAGVTSNGSGMAGVAPGAKILPIRALGACGSGWSSDIIDGIIWASGGTVPGIPANANPAQVINMSLGGGSSCSTSYQNAIDAAVSRGTTVVAAAGNSSQDMALTSPANCKNVISVAATGPTGELAGYSNYGEGVDVSAPGGDGAYGYEGTILSTVNSGAQGPVSEGGSGDAWAFMQGTSMAAPHVAGAVALMKAANPSLSPVTIEAQLKETAKPIASPCEYGCGSGIVDAADAVAYAATGEIPSEPEEGLRIRPGTIVVKGVAAVGQTLTVDTGTWEPTPVEISYQWMRAGAVIAGATGSAYTLTPADTAKTLWAVATGAKSGFDPVTAESNRVVIEAGALTSSQPSLSGYTHQVGYTFTIHPGDMWGPGDVALSFSWKRDGSVIPDATEATYKLSEADLGKAVQGFVTGTKPGYKSLSRATSATEPVQGGRVSASTPEITGSAVIGSTLEVTDGRWGPNPVTLRRQWLRNGNPITGATGTTYKVTASDRGARLSVSVTGVKPHYTTITRTSTQTGTVQDAAVRAGSPTITGTPRVGLTLKALPGGNWSPTPEKYTYQWVRDGVALQGETGTSYELTGADLGKKISVKVTGHKAGYASATAASAVAAAIASGTLAWSKPTIAGSGVVGKTLNTDPGAWTNGVTLSYQWFRSGTTISGATRSAYVVTASDLGESLVVKVTGKRHAYNTVTSASNATAPIAAGTLTPPTPSISGPATVGGVLTASAGTWDRGVSIKYQWLRSGKAISGATAATYKVVPADDGATLGVKVTRTKPGYKAASATATATNRVTTGAFPGTPFTDIKRSPFSDEIRWMFESELSGGYPDGTYRPLDAMNRDAMAAFIYRLAGSPSFPPPKTRPFKDIPINHVFAKEIAWMKASGLSNGYPDSTYRPLHAMNRDAMAAFMYRLASSYCNVGAAENFRMPASSGFADVPRGTVFFKEIAWMRGTGVSNGWVDDGKRTFRPVAPVTRETMAAFVQRLDAYQDENGGCNP